MSLTFRLFIATVALSLLALATIMVPFAAMEEHLIYFILFYLILCLAIVATIIPPKQGVALLKAIGIVIFMAVAVFIIHSIFHNLYEGKVSLGRTHQYVYLKDDPARFYSSAIFQVVETLAILALASSIFMGWKGNQLGKPKRQAECGDRPQEEAENVWIISEINNGKKDIPINIVRAAASSAIILLIMTAITLQLAQPWITAVANAVAVSAIIYLFLFRSVTLDNENKTATITRQLFAHWTVQKQSESLSNFYAVRIRVKVRNYVRYYRVEYLVELVGLHGSTLLLKSFRDLDDACNLRNSVSQWLKVNILFDPSFPQDRPE